MPAGPDDERMPTWVKATGAVLLLLLAGVAALHLTGNGFAGHA